MRPQIVTNPRRRGAVGLALSLLVLTWLSGPATGQTKAAFLAFIRGRMHLEKKSYDRAAVEFRKAIAISPTFAAARNNLGVCLYKRGQFDAALKEFEQVIASGTPHAAGGALNAGAALVGKGELDGALAKSQAAQTAKADYAEAFFNIGWVQDERGEFSKAVSAYRSALSIRPRYVKAKIALGVALAKDKQFDDALETLEKVQKDLTVPLADRAMAAANFKVARIHAAMANPSPQDKATGVRPGSVSLRWGAKLRKAHPLPSVTFKVRFAPAGVALASQSARSAIGNNYRFSSTLSPGQKYAWQLVARTPGGQEAFGEVWTFTCQGQGTPVVPTPPPVGATRAPVVVKLPRVVTPEDTPAPVTLRGSDPDGGPISFRVTNAPSHGTLTGAPPQLTYRPRADFSGLDSFTYVVVAGRSTSAPGTVDIVVTPVDDPPRATAMQVQLKENASARIVLAGTDPDSANLTFQIVRQPARGRLTGTPPAMTYVPHHGAHGEDVFTFLVRDATTASPPAEVRIRIAPQNDPPVAKGGAIRVCQDASARIDLLGTDPDGDSLTYRILEKPPQGELTGDPPSMTYEPGRCSPGDYHLTYVVSDGTVDSEPATIRITVGAYYREHRLTFWLMVIAGGIWCGILTAWMMMRGRRRTAWAAAGVGAGLLLLAVLLLSRTSLIRGLLLMVLFALIGMTVSGFLRHPQTPKKPPRKRSHGTLAQPIPNSRPCHCPGCGATFAVLNSIRNVTFPCPACGIILEV